MTQEKEKSLFEVLTDKRTWLEIGIRFKALFLNCKDSLPIRYICLFLMICSILVWIRPLMIRDSLSFETMVNLFSWTAFKSFLLLFSIIGFFSSSHESDRLENEFIKIGFKNRLDEPPILVHKHRKHGIVKILFYSDGIPLSTWTDKKDALENILNMTIASIQFGKTQKYIQLSGCSGLIDYHKTIYLKEINHTNKPIIYLGESLGSPVQFSFNDFPHILIGGATGSGKTYLLKLILAQAIAKKYEIHISDYKGGIDYGILYRRNCTFSVDEMQSLETLQSICIELERRKKQFAELNTKDIDTYNAQTGAHLKRIIFACDEIAEMLSTTGLSKEDKELVRQLEKHLNMIARLGRALGIHLILATQRPDADVLNGQIKANVTYRICGKADDVLSRIILDSTDASTVIPKDCPGVFVNHEGIVFKGYLFDERIIL